MRGKPTHTNCINDPCVFAVELVDQLCGIPPAACTQVSPELPTPLRGTTPGGLKGMVPLVLYGDLIHSQRVNYVASKPNNAYAGATCTSRSKLVYPCYALCVGTNHTYAHPADSGNTSHPAGTGMGPL